MYKIGSIIKTKYGYMCICGISKSKSKSKSETLNTYIGYYEISLGGNKYYLKPLIVLNRPDMSPLKSELNTN